MKKSRVLVLGIAFVAAAGAALLAKNIVGETKTKRIVTKEFMNTTEVLVAAKEIKIGDMVGAKQLKWQKWPKDALNSTIMDRSKYKNAIKDYDKAIARSSFMKGTPINPHNLIKRNQGGIMAAILMPGMRAVSTKIKASTAAGGFILPNDRVDVILSRKLKGREGARYISNTILSNVRVLAIGKRIETSKEKKTSAGKTATLELSLGEAEILTLADKMGSISLVLRGISSPKPGSDNNKVTSLRGGDRRTIRIFKFGRKVQAVGM